MTKRIIALAGCAVLISACASTPKEEPVIEAPVEAPQVQEEIAEPMPVEPPVEIEEDNLEDVEPEYVGPEPGTLDDFVYQSGGDPRVYFSYDQYRLSDGVREVLRQQAQWLMLYPDVTAIIEGNADERGTREYNLALGQRRANSIKEYLVNLGVAPSRLTTISYGKERPIDDRPTEMGWAKNRNGHTNLVFMSIVDEGS